MLKPYFPATWRGEVKFKSGSTGHSFLQKFPNSPAVKIYREWNHYGEEGANTLQQNSCHAGNEVQKTGLPIKPWEESHVRYDTDSKHNTALTLRKIKQESVIREPMKGEKYVIQ